jgi:hypothetical protein
MSHDFGGPTQMSCAHYEERTGSKDIDENLIRVKNTAQIAQQKKKQHRAAPECIKSQESP